MIIAPVKGKYKVTSDFGWRVHPITGKRRLHTGTDIVTGRANTPIIAVENGIILEAKKSTAPGGGYGWFVKYRGESGAVHLKAHLVEGSIMVKKGDSVKQGQKLGVMGTSGSSTGIHLHWEVRGKVPVDPIKWMERQNNKAPEAPQKPQKPAARVNTTKEGVKPSKATTARPRTNAKKARG